MHEDDRLAIARSIGNLWVFNGIFIARLLETLRKDGALSDEAIQKLVRAVDEASQHLVGEDDQDFATEMLASVRAWLSGS